MTRIEREHIDRYAQVDRALARFHGDVIGRFATTTSLDPLELRRWCEEQLITAGGTRALMYRGSDATEGIDNAVIDALESEHLIRGEARAGAHWYELSHDKFVEAIQTGNGAPSSNTAKPPARWANRRMSGIASSRSGSVNFARRSDSQFVHTMKAPIGPYFDWIDAIELAGAWPFNLLLPVAGATGLGLVAVEIGWVFAAVFFPALVLGTLLAVAAYVDSQI